MISEHSRSSERPARAANGVLMLLVGLLLLIAGPVSVAQPVINDGALYG